jgi:hypothetical protein
MRSSGEKMKNILINTYQAADKYEITPAKVNRIVREKNVPYDIIKRVRRSYGKIHTRQVTTYIFSTSEFEKALKSTLKSRTQRRQSKAAKARAHD